MRVIYKPIEEIKPRLTTPTVDPELDESIREKGVLTVLMIRPNGRIVDGQCRYDSAIRVGLKELPCCIVEMSDEQAEEANLMRCRHSIRTKPSEYLRALQFLVETSGLTQKEIAEKIGKSSKWLGWFLSLRKLDPLVLQALDQEEITRGVAFHLTHRTPEVQRALLPLVKGLSIREVLARFPNPRGPHAG